MAQVEISLYQLTEEGCWSQFQPPSPTQQTQNRKATFLSSLIVILLSMAQVEICLYQLTEEGCWSQFQCIGTRMILSISFLRCKQSCHIVLYTKNYSIHISFLIPTPTKIKNIPCIYCIRVPVVIRK
jgi:hypothetical protein